MKTWPLRVGSLVLGQVADFIDKKREETVKAVLVSSLLRCHEVAEGKPGWNGNVSGVTAPAVVAVVNLRKSHDLLLQRNLDLEAEISHLHHLSQGQGQPS